MLVYLNGQMVEAESAGVSASDAGFQHAVGLFETFGAYGGRVFLLEEHLQRLAESATQLGLAAKLRIKPLAEAVEMTLKANDLQDARIRLTLTAGDVSMLKPSSGSGSAGGGVGGGAGGGGGEPTLLIQATPPTVYDPSYFQDGILAMIGPGLHNPFDPTHGHKTLNYWPRLRALRQAASVGAGEAICLSVTNHLAAGCISNVFLVKDEALYTPIARGEEAEDAIKAPVLPGVTRQAVVGLAEEAGLSVHKQMLSVADLLEADEVFLTNSSWHILPVKAVEQHKVSDGIGPVTAGLRLKLLELMQGDAV